MAAFPIRNAVNQIGKALPHWFDRAARGYDPIQGIMHNSHKGSPALVLDFIELERPRVDAQVLDLVVQITRLVP